MHVCVCVCVCAYIYICNVLLEPSEDFTLLSTWPFAFPLPGFRLTPTCSLKPNP